MNQKPHEHSLHIKPHQKKLEQEVQEKDQNILFEERDSLTGLASLAFFRDMMSHFINEHPQKKSTIFILGLDDFNTLNHTLGSYIGDFILKKIAEKIQHYADNAHIIARKGGDEFIIVLQENQSSLKKINQLLREIAHPLYIGEKKIFLTASIGISIYPQDAMTTEELLTCADIALRHAKSVGKNNIQYFKKKLGNKIHLRNKIFEKLSLALDQNEFFLCYQPQIEASGKHLVGIEALLRWKNPELGLIDPNLFIPIAEETLQILHIGEWALKTACLQGRLWQPHQCPLRIAVNISGRQLQYMGHKSHLINSIKRCLEISALSPQQLELEITESVLMKCDGTLIKDIKNIKELGVRIACDDFGTGYSSFYRLKKLPIDTIKIDRSLIKDIGTSSLDEAIISSIITIIKKLNITCVAEGVEYKEQYEKLQALGCDVMQGYYFYRPMTAKGINKILKKYMTISKE